MEELARIADERRQTIDQRRHDIKNRLLTMGWTDQTLSSFWTFPGVSDPVALTEPEWIKLQNPLVKHLRRSLRKRRREETRSAIPYPDMLKSDPRPDLFPPYDIFIYFESVKAVWDIRVSSDTPIELEHFRPLRPDVWGAALPEINAAVIAYQDRMVALAEERLTAAYRARGMPIPPNPLGAPIPRWRYHTGCKSLRSYNMVVVDKRVQHVIATFPRIHALM